MMRRAADGRVGFALDAPRAVIKRPAGAGGRPEVSEPPEQKISDYRLIANMDPHIGESIDTLVDYLVGSGFSIQPANIPFTDQEQTDEDIAAFKLLIETSEFETVLYEWVWHALVDGTAFLEIVVEDDVFKPKLLPTERMKIQTDDKGEIIEYLMEREDGGDDIKFGPYDIAHLTFHKHPGEDFGHSLIERIEEQANFLRDMEIDLARFISTKAYPPVIWKCGTEERPWNDTQIEEWLDTVEMIEPESMIAVGHDVDHEVVGVTSTSTSAGMLNLDSTFAHLQKRIAAGLGIPAFLLNMDADVGRNDSITLMPKFDRRIQRYRSIIKNAIRYQIFVSILGENNPEDYDELPPDYVFGEHSSDEGRLEIDSAIKLFNEGFLTREAFAQRVGIDPETELPDESELVEIVGLLQDLRGAGDSIQNPNGGSPTSTGSGAESAGREVRSRQNPERDSSGGRRQRDVSNE
ncbi:phage portal protein [Natronorubrum bangense]|uniref:Phage portal protein n=3 Tax=Natronorubrum bangense TaxID=61858 RepID=A0A4D6HMX4_9EURY|nr:phage portal protein [Natronorubrum bangense]